MLLYLLISISCRNTCVCGEGRMCVREWDGHIFFLFSPLYHVSHESGSWTTVPDSKTHPLVQLPPQAQIHTHKLTLFSGLQHTFNLVFGRQMKTVLICVLLQKKQRRKVLFSWFSIWFKCSNEAVNWSIIPHVKSLIGQLVIVRMCDFSF